MLYRRSWGSRSFLLKSGYFGRARATLFAGLEFAIARGEPSPVLVLRLYLRVRAGESQPPGE